MSADRLRGLSADALAELRCRVVAAAQAGVARAEIARLFGISQSTVSKWVHAFRATGDTSSRPRRTARVTPFFSTLTVEQRDDVIATILQRSASGGSDGLMWTRERTADLISERLGARPSLLVVSNLLRNWGFTSPEPLPNAAERDPDALHRWRVTEYRNVAAAASRTDAPIFWITSRVRHRPSVAVRLADGTPLTEPESGMSVLSALSDDRSLFFTAHAGLTEAATLCDFLDRLCTRVGQRVHAVVDIIPLSRPDLVDTWLILNRHRIQALMLT